MLVNILNGVALVIVLILFCSSLKAWNCCSERDSSLPEVDGIAHSQAAVSASGQRNCAGLQD